MTPVFLQALSAHTQRGLSGLPGGAAAFAVSRLIAAEDPLDPPPMALPLLSTHLEQVYKCARFYSNLVQVVERYV